MAIFLSIYSPEYELVRALNNYRSHEVLSYLKMCQPISRGGIARIATNGSMSNGPPVWLVVVHVSQENIVLILILASFQ